jgi:hypothetical protein
MAQVPEVQEQQLKCGRYKMYNRLLRDRIKRYRGKGSERAIVDGLLEGRVRSSPD